MRFEIPVPQLSDRQTLRLFLAPLAVVIGDFTNQVSVVGEPGSFKLIFREAYSDGAKDSLIVCAIGG